MGLVRGYIAFQGKEQKDFDKIRREFDRISLEGMIFYSNGFLSRNEKHIDSPVMLFDGKTNLKSSEILDLAINLMEFKEKPITYDISTTNEGDFMHMIKEGCAECGNYFGIRVLPAKHRGELKIIETARYISLMNRVKNVSVRSVERTADQILKKYCIDVITEESELNFLKNAQTHLDRLHVLKDEATRMYGIKRMR